MNIINTLNIESVKNQIKTYKEKQIIVNAQNDDFNRKILEYGKFNVLLLSSSFLLKKKDKLKHLDSGFNHVLGKIATKNKISIGFDLNELRSKNKKEKAIILSKIIQNIKICRKTKTKIVLFNHKDEKDSFSLMISLGSSTQQAKN